MRARTLRMLAMAAMVLAAACSSGAATISGGEAGDQIADLLAIEEDVGQRPPEVRCPNEITVEAGGSFRCTLVAGDGSEIGLTATFTDDDRSVDAVKVDDTVSSPPTTVR